MPISVQIVGDLFAGEVRLDPVERNDAAKPNCGWTALAAV